jgi:hypothetical protein
MNRVIGCLDRHFAVIKRPWIDVPCIQRFLEIPVISPEFCTEVYFPNVAVALGERVMLELLNALRKPILMVRWI